MPQIVQAKSPVLAAVADQTDYIKARNQAETLSNKYGLPVADMPLLIQAMNNHSEVRDAIRPVWIDTITGEYHGQRDGDRSYEAWHPGKNPVFTLSTAMGLEKLFSQVGDYAFMPISNDEWVSVGKGDYKCQNIARIHLEDAKKGNVPVAGIPYTIFVRLDKDKPNINDAGRLNYDNFMQDDRVLMITGSPESREALAKLLFGKKEEGGEGWASIGSYHRIKEVGFNAKAKGRPAFLCNRSCGLDGLSIYDFGRFAVVVAPEAHVAREKTAPQNTITQQTLEQTLAVINNPDLNREGMIKTITQLHKR